jgi:hypothetical protein
MAQTTIEIALGLQSEFLKVPLATAQAEGGKSGPGYLFGVLRGCPRGRCVESKPSTAVLCAAQSDEPRWSGDSGWCGQETRRTI